MFIRSLVVAAALLLTGAVSAASDPGAQIVHRLRAAGIGLSPMRPVSDYWDGTSPKPIKGWYGTYVSKGRSFNVAVTIFASVADAKQAYARISAMTAGKSAVRYIRAGRVIYGGFTAMPREGSPAPLPVAKFRAIVAVAEGL